MEKREGGRARVAVYCGANVGASPIYAEAARALGAALVRAGLGIAYGGAAIGLMGAVADGAMAVGGDVVGVLPRALDRREIAHTGITALHRVETMHERKARLAALSDGFVVLPGGVGTLDEFFEAWTWAQLGLHDKPIALLDLDGFYQPLLAHLRHTVAAGFLRADRLTSLVIAPDVATPVCSLTLALARSTAAAPTTLS